MAGEWPDNNWRKADKDQSAQKWTTWNAYSARGLLPMKGEVSKTMDGTWPNEAPQGMRS
jgi:hypothetical protein